MRSSILVMPLYVLLLSVLLLSGVLPAASAEEQVLADEWTAEFEAGVKVSWAHQRITETKAEDGGRRFVLVNRGWTPVGAALIEEEERVTTDSTGRVLSWRMTTKGPRGRYEASVEGRKYRVVIRDEPPVDGELEKDAYKLGVVLALIRRGALPPGAKKLHVLDLPGEGLKERKFSMVPNESGLWYYSRADQVVMRSAKGRLVGAHDKDRPFWSKHRTTAEKAPDRAVTDKPMKAKDGSRLEGKTVAVARPEGPWILRRQADRFSTMTGLDHPLQVIVAAVEFETALGAGEAERLSLAATLRDSLNQQPHMPQFSKPEIGRFQGRPSVEYTLSGKVNMEPVAGRAHLVRSRTGQAVLVVAFYALGIGEPSARLMEIGIAHLKLDGVAPRATKWRRVMPSTRKLTLEVPGTWLRVGMENRWMSPQKGSQMRVNEGKLPAEVDMETAQKLWVAKLHKDPRMRDVQLQSTEEVDIDGRTMVKTVMTCIVPQPKAADVAMTAVSVGLVEEDDSFVEIVTIAFDLDWDAKEIDRLIGSVRWESTK